MRLTHPGCDGWEQRGEQTSHCSNCHRTFSSLDAFDHHQEVMPDRMVYKTGVKCHDPAEMTRRDGRPWYISKEAPSTSEIRAVLWERSRPDLPARTFND